jgi:hypothetical protein
MRDLETGVFTFPEMLVQNEKLGELLDSKKFRKFCAFPRISHPKPYLLLW